MKSRPDNQQLENQDCTTGESWGVREGAGRKFSGRSGQTVRLTDSVWENLEAEAAQTGASVSAVIE